MTGGIISGSGRWIEAKAQAVAGPGLGVWADASLLRVEASLGNVVGVHLDLNVNTGVGVQNGNLDVHFLGYGGRIGADGISSDTPVVTSCNIM